MIFFLSSTVFSFNIREDREVSIYLLVFHSREDFPDDDKKAVFGCITKPSETEKGIEVDLAEGSYAITIFQDIDGDSSMDRWFFGKPREPYGISGADKKPLKSPIFENSCINLKTYETIDIQLWKP